MKPLVTHAPDDDWKMVCPYCGDNYIHHGQVVVYEREHEDGPTFVLNSILKRPVWEEWAEERRHVNPSRRRNAIQVHFWGECGHQWILDLYQHKGETFLNSHLFLEPDDSEASSLASMPYVEYLKTEHWQRVREGALVRAEHRCQLCNTTEFLNVHHRTYENRGAEKDSDVTVLCKPCHERFHDIRSSQPSRSAKYLNPRRIIDKRGQGGRRG